MNGALTIGTLDGANVEIREEVGDENIFIFGLKAHEVEAQRASYDPRHFYRTNPALARVVDSLASNVFCPQTPGHFKPIHACLMDHGDEYFHLADFASYIEGQAKVSALYADQKAWTRMSMLNTARIGKFSSDRTIREYASDIWKIRSAA
jgi:starch phosphorylase